VTAFADEREERLARRVASQVGCTPADTLVAVRNELPPFVGIRSASADRRRGTRSDLILHSVRKFASEDRA
jgi:hypothetical protein